MSHIKSPTQTKKKLFNIGTTYYLITQKNTHYALTQLYSFTGLKVIQNNPHTDYGTKEQHDIHLENQSKKSAKTKNNTKKLDQNIPQKERKNRKMTEKIIPQEQIDKLEHRESSRLRNQPRKNYKTFIPQSKILKKFEFQKQL